MENNLQKFLNELLLNLAEESSNFKNNKIINCNEIENKIFYQINQLKEINRDLYKKFLFKLHFRNEIIDIYLKRPFFPIKLNIKYGVLKLDHCINNNQEALTIKIGQDDIQLNEYNFSILEAPEILMFCIINLQNNAEIAFTIESQINLHNYGLTEENKLYKLKSYIKDNELSSQDHKILKNFKNLIILYCLSEGKSITPINQTYSSNIYLNENSLRGLINIDGSYCYMNSIIQSLFAIEVFRKLLLSKKYDCNYQTLSYALKDIFYQLSKHDNSPCNPSNFKAILSTKAKLFKKIAGDPSDLILYLLDQIHEENKKESNYIDRNINEENEKEVYENCIKGIDKSIISDLFYGFYGEKSSCLKCKKTYFMIEPKFLFEMNANIMRQLKINKLSEYFKYYKENIAKKYFICPRCGKYFAHVQNIIKELPQILIIILKNENQIKIELEKEIIFNNLKYIFISSSTIAYRPSNTYYGHAIAYCLHNGQYYLFNDSCISIVDFTNIKYKDHYVLFYLKG